MQPVLRVTLGVVLPLIAGGCTHALPDRNDFAPTQTAMPAQVEEEVLWTAAQDVLREHFERLDRVDVRAGIITTFPVTSQQFFEFWRKDVATAADGLEANVRTVRRWAEFTIEPAEAGGDLRVNVYRELISTPERQYTNSAAAFQVFAFNLPAAQTGERIRPEDTYWIEDGRDPAMETYLLDRILTQAGATPPSPAS